MKSNSINSRHVFLALASIALIAGGAYYEYSTQVGYSERAQIGEIFAPPAMSSADHVGAEQGFAGCKPGWRFPQTEQDPITGEYTSVPQRNTPGQPVISVTSLGLLTSSGQRLNVRIPTKAARRFHRLEFVTVTCRGGKVSVSPALAGASK